VFEDALDRGFLGSHEGASMPFAILWANRMPRRVLPVRRGDLPVVEDARRVPSDVDDFVHLVATLAHDYFWRPNYLRVEGRPYFSIYDSTYFIEELGLAAARAAVQAARAWLRAHGQADLHLAAIEPARHVIAHVRDVGFDSVTHYVLLPDWKGPLRQDYATYAERRAREWPEFARAARLPYLPSVASGWDASPRAADFGPEKPRKYPWSPVVVGEHPERFHEALERAVRYAASSGADEPLVFVASQNEWSEGHYLEPDTRFGHGWLEAVKAAR
jgi:nucleotide-binding universal stress UspA family protein